MPGVVSRRTFAYQQAVLPTGVKARVSVEAAVAMGWRDLIGDAGESVSIEHFGASAAYATLSSSSASRRTSGGRGARQPREARPVTGTTTGT